MAHDPDSRHLRLTLRTLLAWLDDTLPAAEVQHISGQVRESEVAQQLVEKIQRVTRRRRLTVPPTSGPDATDANLVAAYLDNELNADQVTDYEKKCLTSDVHLAEVASCHQVLSLIGQRAKVPAEARHRMYRLVKGHRPTSPGPVAAAAKEPPEPNAWPSPEPAASRGWPSWLLPGVLAALVLLMGVSAWMLAPPAESPPAAQAGPAAGDRVADNRPAPAPILEPAPAQGPADAPAGPTIEPAPAEAEAPAPAAEPAPAGGPSEVASADGLVLRWNPENRGWDLLAEGSPLRTDDRLVGLAPFRSALKVDGLDVVLVGPTEVRLQPPGTGRVPRLDLVWGRVEIGGSGAADSAEVATGEAAVRLGGLSGRRVGVERLAPTEDAPEASGLGIHAPEGPVTAEAGGKSVTLQGPASLDFVAPDGLTEPRPGKVPDWVADRGGSEADRAAGAAFRGDFKPGLATVRSILEALEDDSAGIQALAVEALGSLGMLDLVVRELDHRSDPNLRRAAASALRDWNRRGPAGRSAVREELARYARDDADWAKEVGKLLDRYDAEEAGEAGTYSHLVPLLEHRDVAVRQLALDELMRLTDRDALGYDPDEPRGAGLKEWQDLARSGKLVRRPAAEK